MDSNTQRKSPMFAEVARYRICPREGQYGIQIPTMAWHTLEVREPSTIFEAKDGAYEPLQDCDVLSVQP